ncbi:PTS glucitol transporter subunit IIA [Klebsiella grimontii]|mgnify:FL=1|jgi:PTS system fructose-specific IIB component/fructose-specific PTS system IIB-like component|uniref:protein-N(pi)-phosphohistidine--D-fructose phosphotransferase n=1 Tax=Klebsiella grimontii TaxID=2058152 RepID=A0A5D1WDX2_9ENTR|nr:MULTISPECIES: fructose PTS transporter subunit IIB [Klebsiella]EBX6544414.1 PTS glucitol transporter subunit IIA [Salmonella enterica subsp. enterica serovar Larochelle]MBW5980958.1 PTS glucitol transporter subunit IIA [Klebsiella michiganensis]RFP50149.1 PTS glucitol transporter subunit IIA [Klebsiella oxytoca]KAA0493045.1 PTS glucitol transporter subunit IIA [Klebsiella grimontii]MBM1117580.1 PTS glucitol transporter subunit IIA [Klebsiella grimontii]
MSTRAGRDEIQPFSSERNLHIVAVTACATGVAHTYMAAEQLEKLAKQYRFAIKIETQGVLGLKNKITDKDIFESELAIIASDITIDNPSRFDGCRVLNVCINSLLLKPTEVIAAMRKSLNLPRGNVIDL